MRLMNQFDPERPAVLDAMRQHSRGDSRLRYLRSLGRTLFVGFCGLVSISMALSLLIVLLGFSLFVTGLLPLNG
jgi:hypothetical protein